jgi:hypothetical protein
LNVYHERLSTPAIPSTLSRLQSFESTPYYRVIKYVESTVRPQMQARKQAARIKTAPVRQEAVVKEVPPVPRPVLAPPIKGAPAPENNKK